MMSTEFDDKLSQQAKDTSRIADELKGKFLQNREQVTEQIAKLSEDINKQHNIHCHELFIYFEENE
jgi:hypothetical protein